MSANITRLDDHRPSPLKRAAAAWRRFWNHLTDLPDYSPTLPIVSGGIAAARLTQKPLNWPLSKSPSFDEYLLDLARQRGLVVRTRAGHRVKLDKMPLPLEGAGEISGLMEFLEDCELGTRWRPLHWMDDGSFGVLEHDWDLVSVETASCIHCDRHDIDMDYDMSWSFVTVDRARGLGVCSRCYGGEAA